MLVVAALHTYLMCVSCLCSVVVLSCVCRVLGEVAQRVGDRDVLPAELREEYGLSGWMEDLRELHNPSGSLERYQRAKRGLAFRVRAEPLSHADTTQGSRAF
jgi:hypothetical protein